MRLETCIVIGYPQVQKLNINHKTPMGHRINLPDKVITGTQKMLMLGASSCSADFYCEVMHACVVYSKVRWRKGRKL